MSVPSHNKPSVSASRRFRFVPVLDTTTLPHYHTTTLPHYHTTTLPHHRTTAPPHHRTTTLPHYHTTTLPHCHTTAPPHHRTTAPPHYHTTTLPHYHTTTLPHCHTTAPPHHRTTTLPHYHTTTLPHYHTTTLPHYHTTVSASRRFRFAPVLDIAKELTLHRSLMNEIEDMTPRRRSALISGKHLRKAKCARELSKELHTHRRHLFAKPKRDAVAKIARIRSDNAKHHIATYLCRPDNSDELPGKRNAVKVGKVKRQKHALKNCLRNLHAKYASEFPLKKDQPIDVCEISPEVLHTCNVC